MRWQKRGHVYAPDGSRWWARAYAAFPTAELIDDGVIRVYFASLDSHRYGRIGYVDLDATDPCRILSEAPEPVLDVGQPGAFDDCGVNPSCILAVDGRRYLYYIGWQRCERVPYMLFAGLAVSDGALFRKHSQVPVLDRTASEPFSRSAPMVLREQGLFKMWYWSCEYWSQEGGSIHYNTVIRYAESADGVRWAGRGGACITPTGPGDYAVGRPWVIHDGPTYRMWYSIRSKAPITYRLGYAESADGVTWERRDGDVGIEASSSGWDSEMVCFPCVIDAHGSRYLFYNGNRHGATGFGYAVLTI